MKLKYGERNFVIFDDENEYYIALGYLSNPKRGIRFDWENYDNKWGIEGRIWITNSLNAPSSLRRAFSAGTDAVDHRLNCNEYLKSIIRYNNIPNGRLVNSYISNIKSTVPPKFVSDFDHGFNL